MKNIKYNFLLFIALLLMNSACSDWLEPQVYSSISVSNFLQTKADFDAALTGVYGDQADTYMDLIYNGEWGTDEFWSYNRGSNLNEFLWTPGGGLNLNIYEDKVRAVTRAGAFLLEVEGTSVLTDSEKKQMIGEIKVNRAIQMYHLLINFGACPVILNEEALRLADNDFFPERPQPGTPQYAAYEVDYINQILTDLNDGIEFLPVRAIEFGRMDGSIAMMIKLKLFMHQKDWSNAAQIAQDIMDLDEFELYDSFSDIFNINHEQNSEIIWAIPRLSNVNGQTFRTQSLGKDWDLTDEQKWDGDKIRFEFLDTFDTTDVRRQKIIDKFIDSEGDTIDLRNTGEIYGAYVLKYDQDPDATRENGTDVVMLRFADVLLCRAEALNELNGPSQESIDLINSVRKRTGLDELLLADFSTRESLRDHILKERGWEFYLEGLRREDLIRHGKYIEYAQARGATAQDHHVLYPIPRSAYTENENIEQNPGYDF